MVELEIDVGWDHVVIEKHRVPRPSYIPPSVWMYLWERVCKILGRA